MVFKISRLAAISASARSKASLPILPMVSINSSGSILLTQGLHYLTISNGVGPVFGWAAIGLNAASGAFVNFNSISIVLTITHSINFALDDLHIIVLVVIAGAALGVLTFPNAGVFVGRHVEYGQTAALYAF
jgi:hypothetical protein